MKTSEESLDNVCHKDICPFAFVEPVDVDELESQIQEFRKNIDPALDIYASKVQPSISDEEKYLRECHKYCLTPVEKFKNFLKGSANDRIVLNHYQCGSLQIQIITEIALGSPLNRITEINLSNNFFDETSGHGLADLIQQSVTLQSLNLANCRIGPQAAAVLAEALPYSQSLKFLNLSNCNLRDSGGSKIAEAFKYNDSCKTLILSKNELANLTGTEFGQVFRVNTTLEELELGWNELYSEQDCMVPFMKGLLTNSTLKKLGLSWNALFGSSFIFYLCKVVRLHSTLNTLDLAFNRLRETETVALAKSLKKAKQLANFIIANNPFTDAAILQLLSIFKDQSCVKFMDLGRELYLEPATAQMAEKIMNTQPDVNIVYKGQLMPNPPEPVDRKAIALDRCKFLGMKPKRKKNKRNMGHFMLQLQKLENPLVTNEDFINFVKAFKAKLDENLVEFLMEQFLYVVIEKKRKTKRVNVHEMAEFYLKRHPTVPPAEKPTSKRKRRKKLKK